MAGKSFVVARVAAIPVLLALGLYLEMGRPLPFFRLLTFACLFILLADLTTLACGRLRDFLLIATSIVFGVLATEAAAEILSDEPVLITSRGLTGPQPVIGWGPQHPGRFHARKFNPETGAVIYDVDYTIDANLLRQTKSCDTCSTIAFFGDSLTFGEGINDPDTLPQALADSFDRKLRVLNLAFSGYGPQQFLRELETGRFYSVIGSRPELFVFLTASWHAQRTACKAGWVLHAPRYALENGKPVFQGDCYTGPALRLREWAGHSAIYRSLIESSLERLTRDDVDLYIRILLAAVELAKEKYGVPTLIAYLRVSKRYLRGTGFSDDEIIKRLRDGGADVIDISLSSVAAKTERLSIPGDGHPTPYANRLMAAILKSHIEQNFPHLLVSKKD